MDISAAAAKSAPSPRGSFGRVGRSAYSPAEVPIDMLRQMPGIVPSGAMRRANARQPRRAAPA